MDKSFSLFYKYPITIKYKSSLSGLPSYIREVRECLVVINDCHIITIYFDERFNEIVLLPIYTTKGEITKEVSEYLRLMFDKLKQTDFRWRISDGLESDKILYLETFLDFLKVENRNNIINQIVTN